MVSTQKIAIARKQWIAFGLAAAWVWTPFVLSAHARQDASGASAQNQTIEYLGDYSGDFAGNTRMTHLSGEFHITVTYSGSRVTAAYSGKNLTDSTLEGTRSGDKCVFTEHDGSQWTATCQPGKFSGGATNDGATGQRYMMTFSTVSQNPGGTPAQAGTMPLQAQRGRCERFVSCNVSIRSNPRPTADGFTTCSTLAEVPGLARVRIVEARLADRPPVRGAGAIVTGGIRGYWYLDYTVERLDRRAFSFGDSFMNNRANDSNGRQWQSMDNRNRDDKEIVSAGAVGRAKAIYISYDSDGADVATISPVLDFSMQVPATDLPASMRGSNITYPAGGATIRFPFLPVNCVDQPDAAAAAPHPAAPAASAALILPHQFPMKGVDMLNAPKGSVKEAVQAGYIWSLGEGVPLDFDQGKAWFEEAVRRQEASRDFTFQHAIEEMLSQYHVGDVEQLFNKGLRGLMTNQWDDAIFYFGRAAALGNPQAMAALGYAFGDGRGNPALGVYWCRKGFLAARTTRQEHDLDGVNHFCPAASFDDLMTSAERRANPASIMRAAAESAAIERQFDAQVALVRRGIEAGIRDGLASGGESSGGGGGGGGGGAASYDREMNAASDYAHGRIQVLPINDFYSACHGYGNC